MIETVKTLCVIISCYPNDIRTAGRGNAVVQMICAYNLIKGPFIKGCCNHQWSDDCSSLWQYCVCGRCACYDRLSGS